MWVRVPPPSLPRKGLLWRMSSASRETGEESSGTRSTHLIVQILLHRIFGFTYIAHESFDGKHIPVARTSGDAAQKRELRYAWLPLAAAACSGNRAGLIGEQ